MPFSRISRQVANLFCSRLLTWIGRSKRCYKREANTRAKSVKSFRCLLQITKTISQFTSSMTPVSELRGIHPCVSPSFKNAFLIGYKVFMFHDIPINQIAPLVLATYHLNTTADNLPSKGCPAVRRSIRSTGRLKGQGKGFRDVHAQFKIQWLVCLHGNINITVCTVQYPVLLIQTVQPPEWRGSDSKHLEAWTLPVSLICGSSYPYPNSVLQQCSRSTGYKFA